MRSETLTRSELIDPALGAAGWTEDLIDREFLYRKGRVWLIEDDPHREQAQYADYILRAEPLGLGIAVVEAKSEAKSPGAGLQQAISYASDLGIRFAYSTNGHAVVEQDLLTKQVTTLPTFPGPDALRLRLQGLAAQQQILRKPGDAVTNPLRAPVEISDGRRMRYYQEAAVNAAIHEMLSAKHRALLALATGTGKTFIASNFVGKLRTSGYAAKFLILVDRTSLLSQAYNDFSVFGDTRAIVTGGTDPSFHRDIHFATYQTLYSEISGERVYQRFDPHYFDVVIIDECHRSGYGDWRAILEYFEGAFQLGLTATPKRTDSVDTYAFFAGENLLDGAPTPAYQYSLADGIEDGFLATYQLHRFRTNVDEAGLHIDAQLAQGAELIVPDDMEADIRDVYGTSLFEREILVPDRTRAMCQHLADLIAGWGAKDKTIVFCVTMEHADLVRQELQNRLGPLAGMNRYAVRIVSEERDAEGLLEEFQSIDSFEPALATTVDLLSTGIDAPAVRNIVLMRTISSPSLFKQIIGRGSRISEPIGKLFFRIVDYTNASRLLDVWDVPAPPPAIDTSERTLVPGQVLVAVSGEGVAGAAVRGYSGKVLFSSTVSNDAGAFVLDEMPIAQATVVARADGYRHARVEALIDLNMNPITIELEPEAGRAGRLTISGIDVTVNSEGAITVHTGHGNRSSQEMMTTAHNALLQTFQSSDDLLKRWSTEDERIEIRAMLSDVGVTLPLLVLLLRRPDADDVDALLHLAYGLDILSREQRALRVQNKLRKHLPDMPVALVDALLDKYRVGGVDEISAAAVFQTEPFVSRWGGVRGVSARLGGPQSVRDLLNRLQCELYESD